MLLQHVTVLTDDNWLGEPLKSEPTQVWCFTVRCLKGNSTPKLMQMIQKQYS